AITAGGAMTLDNGTRRPMRTKSHRTKKEARDPDEFVIAANGHIVRHYPIGCLGGTARLLQLGSRELWIVPIMLTSPGYGAVGEVGVVALDARTRAVVGSTPRQEVGVAVQRLREEKHDELEAAFHRA